MPIKLDVYSNRNTQSFLHLLKYIFIFILCNSRDIDYEIVTYANCSKLTKFSARNSQMNSNIPSVNAPAPETNSYLAALTGDINKYNTLALAESKKTIVGQRDESSNLNLQGRSKATSAANALGSGEAISDSTANAGVAGRALENSDSTSRSLSSSESDAFAGDNSVSASKASSDLLVGADSKGDSSATINASSIGVSKSRSAAIQGDAEANSKMNSNFSSNINGVTTTSEEAKEKIVSKMKYLYLGDPLAVKAVNPIKNKIDAFQANFSKDIPNSNTEYDSLYNQVKTPAFTEWENAYIASANAEGNTKGNRLIYNTPKYEADITIDIPENNPNLMDMKFPESELSNLIQSQVKNLENILEERIQVNWVDTDLVAQDISIDSQGHLYAAGLDGYMYEYEQNNNWEKVEAQVENKSTSFDEQNPQNPENPENPENADNINIVRVATGYDATPYVIKNSGETFYLNCNHLWQRLPGCAKDIAVGRGGEVYKIGCERRNGGFRIYKLICNQKCSKNFRKCLRYKSKKTENSDLDVGETKNILNNEIDIEIENLEKSPQTEEESDTCLSSYTFSFLKDQKQCLWFNVAGAGVRVAVHPNGQPFIINDRNEIEYYNGSEWTVIPVIRAIDLAISNQGALFFIAMDFSVYRLLPKKYKEDYSSYRLAKLTGQRAIAITSGPYSQPVIVGEGYKVYSSSKLGYN